MHRSVAIVTLVVALAARAGAQDTGAARGAPPARISPGMARLTFDSAWRRIRATHYDTGMRGVDWDGVRAELLPRAERAATSAELRAVLTEMVQRLGESHFGIVPAEVVEADGRDAADPDATHATALGDVGLAVRYVEGRLMAARVDSGGPAARAGVRPGWTIDSVGTVAMESRVRALATATEPAARREGLLRLQAGAARLLDGPAESTVRVVFRDGNDRRAVRTLERRHSPGEAVRFGNLPTMQTDLTFDRVALVGGRCVGVIRFNLWMTSVASRFDHAMDALRQCAGIVIDIRGNPGGVGAMVMGIAGHFLTTEVPLGVMRSRGSELRFVANPRRVNEAGVRVEPYAGPLAIVVDGLSASTSEIFAAGMQTIGRARVFGDTTAGQALPALLVRLPNGDMLMHVVADFTTPDGTRIEGRGVIPDVVAPLSRADLLAGRDAPMHAALEWVTSR